MSLFGRMLKCVHLIDLRHRAAFGGYYWDNFSMISSRISMFVNNVDSDHGDPVIVHLRCLCEFSLLRYKKIRRRHVPFADMQPFCWSDHRLYFVGFIYFREFILICSMVTLLLIREHLFVKGVCYPSLFDCWFYLRKEHSIRQYDR